jgi:ribonuclease M5
MIKEVIVVEGRDDIAAVKRAVDVELIATSGFGITEKTIERIKKAAERCGVIILTDPDHAGERIRRIVSERVPGCKHAFLPRELAMKDGDIGVENATPGSIRDALSKVKTEIAGERHVFDMNDLVSFGLTGNPDASYMRDLIGSELGIGYGNAKQFLNRLNKYGVTREEFIKAFEKKKDVEI